MCATSAAADTATTTASSSRSSSSSSRRSSRSSSSSSGSVHKHSACCTSACVPVDQRKRMIDLFAEIFRATPLCHVINDEDLFTCRLSLQLIDPWSVLCGRSSSFMEAFRALTRACGGRAWTTRSAPRLAVPAGAQFGYCSAQPLTLAPHM